MTAHKTTDSETLSEITEFGRAKINLTLHVTGQRSDGYHLLDSLVMFTTAADILHVAPADNLTLAIEGPFSDALIPDRNNLVLRAANAFKSDKGASITLIKNLPVASGIGGGSADAAAALRALSQLWDLPLPAPDDILSLGADVPVCMTSELTRMTGIGDGLARFGPAPMLDMLLVNPGVGVSTEQVFGALTSKINPPMQNPMPDPFATSDWLEWLKAQRNDLEDAARIAVPEINDVLTALSGTKGVHIARMSGSGATCFAIYEDAETRDAAASALSAAHPSWWVAPTDEAPL